jgi:concanavalin A-like lectin/glucanase superfamily protein
MNPNARRDLVLGGTVVAFGIGLLAFALFAGDENFRAPRWVVAAAAAAFLFGGSIPLRTALHEADLRPTGKAANLVAAAALFVFTLISVWIMVSVGPEGAAVTLDVPLPFISEAAERLLKAVIFYGVFGAVALAFITGSLIAFNSALPTMGRSAVVAIVAPIIGLMVWVAIEVHRQTVPPYPPVMFLSFDRKFPSDEYLSRPEGREISPRPGRMGTGLFVGGNGDWIDIDTPFGYDTGHGLTLEFWMKRENWVNPYSKGSKMQQVASIDVEREYKGRPEVRQVAFSLELTVPRERVGAPLPEHYYFRPAARFGDVRLAARTVSIPAHRWTHVAVVYDRFLFDTMRLYVDGKQVARAVPWGSDPGFAGIRTVRIGTAAERNGAFRGMVDELKVYARPLSDEEIHASAAKGLY